MVLTVVLALWIIRLPESLPCERRRPLTLGRTSEAIAAVFASRLTIGSALAVMFDMGAFFSFLGSSQLLFDDVYGRGDVFAFYFAGMSVFMGLVVFTGSRLVTRIGADRMIVTLLPITVCLSAALTLWSWQAGGQPWFFGWFAVIVAVNALRTFVNPLIQAQAMGPMGALAGTASAVIGTISMGGGAVLAMLIDRMIAGSVTPLVMAYAGYGAIGLGFALWARRHRQQPVVVGGAAAGLRSAGPLQDGRRLNHFTTSPKTGMPLSEVTTRPTQQAQHPPGRQNEKGTTALPPERATSPNAATPRPHNNVKGGWFIERRSGSATGCSRS